MKQEPGWRLTSPTIYSPSCVKARQRPPGRRRLSSNSRIRRNIKLAEAPSFGQSIFQYQPKSAGALDYGGSGNRSDCDGSPVAGLESDISKTFTLPQTRSSSPGKQRFAA
ncbi:MAG: hypothetical protein R3C11_08120 [Planctomycetaceae bacterium]